MFRTIEGNCQYYGKKILVLWGIPSVPWELYSSVGDTISTVKGVQYYGGTISIHWGIQCSGGIQSLKRRLTLLGGFTISTKDVQYLGEGYH